MGMSLPVQIPVIYSKIFLKNELPVLGKDANATLLPVMSFFLSRNFSLLTRARYSSRRVKSLLKSNSLRQSNYKWALFRQREDIDGQQLCKLSTFEHIDRSTLQIQSWDSLSFFNGLDSTKPALGCSWPTVHHFSISQIALESIGMDRHWVLLKPFSIVEGLQSNKQGDRIEFQQEPQLIKCLVCKCQGVFVCTDFV